MGNMPWTYQGKGVTKKTAYFIKIDFAGGGGS
jgi:hypothetical protein